MRDYRQFFWGLVLTCTVLAQARGARSQTVESGLGSPRAEVIGLEIAVVELPAAVKFYQEILGFVPAVGEGVDQRMRLRNGDVEIVLRQAARANPGDLAAAYIYFNVEVNSLDAISEALEAMGLPPLAGLRETAIGQFASVRDPSGNVHQVVEGKARSPRPFPPRVFNIGIRVHSLAEARRFYCHGLGFEVLSEGHPPPILPLKLQGAVPVILFEAVMEAPEPAPADVAGTSLLLRMAAPVALPVLLRKLQPMSEPVPDCGPGEETVMLLRDPSGHRVKVLAPEG